LGVNEVLRYQKKPVSRATGGPLSTAVNSGAFRCAATKKVGLLLATLIEPQTAKVNSTTRTETIQIIGQKTAYSALIATQLDETRGKEEGLKSPKEVLLRFQKGWKRVYIAG
jgi:hypothetical protein